MKKIMFYHHPSIMFASVFFKRNIQQIFFFDFLQIHLRFLWFFTQQHFQSSSVSHFKCNFADSNDLLYKNLGKFEMTLENSPFPLFPFFLFYCNVSFPLLREFVQKNLSKGSLTFLTAAAVISPFSSFPSSPFAKASANRLSSPGLQLFLIYEISQSSYHDLLPFAFV